MAFENCDSSRPPLECSWCASDLTFQRPHGRTAPTDGITCGTGNDHRSTSDRSSRKDSERHLMAHQPRCPATQSEAAREVPFINSLPHGPSRTHTRTLTHALTYSHAHSRTHPSIHTCTHPAIHARVVTCVCIYLCVRGHVHSCIYAYACV